MQHKRILPTLIKVTLFACFIFAFIIKGSFAVAESWFPQITDYALPKNIIAVDKNKQQFYIYEKKSPLALKATYPCTTGQIVGDKQVVNDLRTPEGVYFINYKIDKGLDFKEYGGVAYTLNYPNPVDKLRNKTGYGIWIHSKGDDADIVPLNTRGCIAIERKNILHIDPLLVPGTVVVVGEKLNTDRLPAKDTGTARHLRFRMEQWTRAWASRSDDLFDFYDANAYSKSMPESFKAFKSNKERLFKILAWINIFNRKVHVMEGPGYWVTWSEQFYRAPNLTTEGIRRLYWQRADDGQYRIVGMEWIPRNVGMKAAFEKGQLVASVDKSISDATSDMQGEIPTPPPVNMPEDAQTPAIMPDQQLVATIPTSDENISLDENVSNELKHALEGRREAWQKRDVKAFYAYYDAKNYGLHENAPSTDFTSLRNEMSRYLRAPWIDVMHSLIGISELGPMVMTACNVAIYMPNKELVQGEERLYWKKDDTGKWQIVSTSWQEKNLGMQADYLEKISSTVTEFVEEWRKTWLSADVKSYASYYANNAQQGTRTKDAMTAQKKNLWANNPPAKVQLSGIRVQFDEKGVRVDMTQVYEGKDKKGDKGTKTLLLEPHNGSWLIVQEEWAASAAGE